MDSFYELTEAFLPVLLCLHFHFYLLQFPSYSLVIFWFTYYFISLYIRSSFIGFYLLINCRLLFLLLFVSTFFFVYLNSRLYLFFDLHFFISNCIHSSFIVFCLFITWRLFFFFFFVYTFVSTCYNSHLILCLCFDLLFYFYYYSLFLLLFVCNYILSGLKNRLRVKTDAVKRATPRNKWGSTQTRIYMKIINMQWTII